MVSFIYIIYLQSLSMMNFHIFHLNDKIEISTNLLCPSPEVEDIAVEFSVPSRLLTLQHDHVTGVSVFVLGYQAPTSWTIWNHNIFTPAVLQCIPWQWKVSETSYRVSCGIHSKVLSRELYEHLTGWGGGEAPSFSYKKQSDVQETSLLTFRLVIGHNNFRLRCWISLFVWVTVVWKAIFHVCKDWKVGLDTSH